MEILNATTGRSDFVGVIAKKGTIKQDAADVERQITECGIPRIIKKGRDEQSLPIIWVVTNENITSNAEKKIRNNYCQYAIHFFAMDDMIRWTDAYAPHLWDDIPSKVGSYLHSMRVELEKLDRDASLLGNLIDGVKIDLELSSIDPNRMSKKNARKATKDEHIQLMHEVKTRKVILLEGQMGAGKSQLLRSLGQEFCSSKVFSDSKILPIFSTYRELVEKHEGSVEKLIKASLGAFSAELGDGSVSALALIDGLDELSAQDDEGQSISALVREIKGLQSTKAVLTCRSGVVPLAVVRAEQDIRHLEVKPISTKRMVNFIGSVCERANLSNRMVKDLGKSDLFKQLPQNPIAAILLTRLMLQSRDRDELPQTLSSLYEKALELMLGRWDLEKGLGSQQEYDAARRVCGEIALFMVENKISVIGSGEVRGRVDTYLRDRNLNVDATVLLERLFSRSGVLVLDSSGSLVSFKHRSFAEFFCAEEWIRSNKFEVDRRALQAYWATIYFFAIGRLSDCEKVLRDVLALQPASADERLGKIFASASYLLAGHMTPYSVVEESFPGLLIEVARYYLDFIEGRERSFLSSLSPMVLLYVFQYVLRQKYGYKFFKKAIDGSAISITDSIEEDAVKAHALFFLGAIGMELDYPDAMRFLVEKYRADSLPIGLSASVARQIENVGKTGVLPALRSFDKRVNKMLKGNASLRATLNRLVSRPISDPSDVTPKLK